MKLLVRPGAVTAASNITTADIFECAEEAMIGIVSAFCGYLSNEENNACTDELCRLILSNGYDYAEVTGSFREIGGDIDRERSIVVINPNYPSEREINEFRKVMTGFAAKYQQDSVFILYGKSKEPTEHKNTSYVDESGMSNNTKTYHYDNLDESGDIDYSDYSYKETLRKDKRGDTVIVEDAFDVVGEMWERKQKYKWGSEESINEKVSRSEYTILRKFTHVTPRIAFSAYSETIDGGAYSIFASKAITEYQRSAVGLQSRMCSGYASRDAIRKNRRKILATTE